MDVDADGSDADRMPIGTGVTTNFKPFTSYRWSKKTPAPNPYLPAAQDRLKHAEDEYALKTTTPERKRDLRLALVQLRDEVMTLKKSSFLIGATDPYIVVPGAFARGNDAPKVGDYALVVFGDAVYPAIVGDIGPNDRVGEASLRIAKQINALSTPYNRPVSDLKVTSSGFSRNSRQAIWSTGFGKTSGALRSIGQGNRRRERAAASLGKYYSASTDANADTDSFAVCESNIDVFSCVFCVAIGDLCISQSEPGRHCVSKSNAACQHPSHAPRPSPSRRASAHLTPTS